MIIEAATIGAIASVGATIVNYKLDKKKDKKEVDKNTLS
jgi:hypothetical protein